MTESIDGKYGNKHLKTDTIMNSTNISNDKDREGPQKYKLMEEILSLKILNTKKDNEIIVSLKFIYKFQLK